MATLFFPRFFKLFSFISNYFKRKATRRIRHVMRGYRILSQSNDLARLRTVKEALTIEALQFNNKAISSFILGAGKNDAEIIIRQYLLLLIGNNMKLDRALLSAIGKRNSSIVYYLPSHWRNIIRQHGFKVAEVRSNLIWYGFVVMAFIRGLLTLARVAYDNVKRNKNWSDKAYVYFSDLTPSNIPQSNNKDVSYDIITWYSQWSARIKNISLYCHNVNQIESILLNDVSVVGVKSFIPPLTVISLCKLISWSLATTFLVMIDLFRGRWWHALLFNEAIKAKAFQLQSSEHLAKEYLFHNMIYRPLWTYEAEKKGSKITFYFYALWSEPFRCFDKFKNVPLEYGLQAMNWPYYLVWDSYQANLLYKALSKPVNLKVVGPIYFNDTAKLIPTLSKNTIAVFDVSSFRESIFRTLPIELAYYTPEIINQFLLDIYNAIKECNGCLALKRKREINNKIHPKYEFYIKKMSSFNNFIFIEPSISSFRLIKNCKAIISIPFTSTAVVAKTFNKPSIYYDPTGLVKVDDIEAHGIPVINTVSKLNEWVKSVLKSN